MAFIDAYIKPTWNRGATALALSALLGAASAQLALLGPNAPDASSGDLADVAAPPISADPFDAALADGYRSLADHAAETFDAGSSRHAAFFEARADDAAAGDSPAPLRVAAVDDPDTRRSAWSARIALTEYFEAGFRERAPDASAAAQVALDCWIRAAEMRLGDPHVVDDCAAAALSHLETLADLQADPDAPASSLLAAELADIDDASIETASIGGSGAPAALLRDAAFDAPSGGDAFDGAVHGAALDAALDASSAEEPEAPALALRSEDPAPGDATTPPDLAAADAPAAPDVAARPDDAELDAERMRFEVYFEHGSAELTDAAREDLRRRLEAALARRPDVRISLRGHADRSGDADLNQRLSERRAEAVRAFLEEMLLGGGAGHPQLSISTVDFDLAALGESRPAVETEDGVPELRNRRVEIALR